jgi:hypothetical protein
MIEDRLIDGKVSLKDLLAQAFCYGVKAGRGDIDYVTRGAWHYAEDILNETEEVLSHRERMMYVRAFALVCKKIVLDQKSE